MWSTRRIDRALGRPDFKGAATRPSALPPTLLLGDQHHLSLSRRAKTTAEPLFVHHPGSIFPGQERGGLHHRGQWPLGALLRLIV
jgi:hypothetical protein